MHVLDWTGSAGFQNELFELLRPVNCTRDSREQYMPRGIGAPLEARLETFGPRAFPERAEDWISLKKWWLENGGNTPNWDIALRANIEGAPGLVLVEAKANKPELRNGAKKPFKLSKQQEQLSAEEQAACKRRSDKNALKIRTALSDANRALATTLEGIHLSCDGDYQLSNRIAFAWWVANRGLPVVLLYLGFTGDEAFGEAMFRDSDDWMTTFTGHLAEIGSPGILDRRIETTGAPFWVLARARRAARRSPPATPRVRVPRV